MIPIAPSFKSALALVVLATPWLVAPLGGPSPAVTAWTAALACLGLVLMLVRWGSADFCQVLVPSAWLLAAVLSAGFALVQYAGLEGPVPFITDSASGDAYGNLRQRNQLATLTAVGLAALLMLHRASDGAAAQPLPRAGALRRGLPCVLAGLLLGAGAAATASRTGLLLWLGVAALAAVWGWLQAPGARRTLWAAGASYAATAALLPQWLGKPAGHNLYARLQDSGLPCAQRSTLWRDVLELIAQKPWGGWGWGELDYAHVMADLPTPRFCALLDNAHNLPLHLAVELGIPLTLGLCGLALWAVWRGAPWREREPARQLAWTVLAAIGVHSLLEYPLWYGPFQLAVLLCLTLLWRPRRGFPPATVRAPLSPLSYATCGADGAPACATPGVGVTSVATQEGRLSAQRALGTALLLLAAYVAWDYHRVSQIYLPPASRWAAYRDDPLGHAQATWLFSRDVQFAQYMLTPLTADTAAPLHAMGWIMLHFSPEPRVLEKLIEASRLLGRDDEARALQARYQAAYPDDYQRWQGQDAR